MILIDLLDNMKALRFTQTAVIGGVGGLVGWVFLQTLGLFQWGLTSLPLFSGFIYEGVAVGSALSLFIFSRDALLGVNVVMLKKKIPLGLVAGALSGLVGFGLGQSLLGLPFAIPMELVRLFSWTILGLCLGTIYQVSERGHENKLIYILFAGLGGGVGGLFGELCQLLLWNPIVNPISLVGIGVVLSFSVVFYEIWSAKACLRVLTGENEGEMYLLDKDTFSLGYQEQNDLVLRGYSEVCKQHACLTQHDQKYQIANVCPGGQVSVNYRFVDQQDVKNGDIIKLGTALLQFCEVS